MNDTAFSDIAEQFRNCPIEERINSYDLGGIAINVQTKRFGGLIVKFAGYRICNIEIHVRLLEQESILPSQSEKFVINTLLLLYLMVMDEVLVMNSERQQIDALIKRVLTGQYSEPEMLMDQFKKMNLLFPMPCVLLLFHIKDMVANRRELQQMSPIYFLFGEQLIIILNPREMDEKMGLIKIITEKSKILGMYSEQIDKIEQIETVFSEMRKCMTSIKHLTTSCGLFPYIDILMKASIYKFASTDEANAVLKKYWHPLMGMKKYAVDMEKFVCCLVENNFNIARTAIELNVHYNTARNYLNEMEEVLNLSTENPDSRFLLSLASKIVTQNSQSTAKQPFL